MLTRRIRAFGFAFRGIAILIAREPHARFHLFATGVVTGLAAWSGISSTEWAVLLLSMGIVWVAEAFNTALERLADRVTTEADPLIKDTKDLAAGAVLLASFAAAGSGLWILVPAVISKLGQ